MIFKCDQCGMLFEGDRHNVLPERECILLNERFPGSEGHHITKSIIVFIPEELHRHVGHDLKKGNNMGVMNLLTLQYIMGNYNERIKMVSVLEEVGVERTLCVMS